MEGKAKEIFMCGRQLKLGDFVRVHYTTGRQGWVEGKITELWDKKSGANCLQGRVESGWCFHDDDEIEEYRASELLTTPGHAAPVDKPPSAQSPSGCSNDNIIESNKE
jgi:hypothetical protein